MRIQTLFFVFLFLFMIDGEECGCLLMECCCKPNKSGCCSICCLYVSENCEDFTLYGHDPWKYIFKHKI